MPHPFTLQLLRSVPVPAGIYHRKDLEELADYVLEAEQITGPAELTLDLVGHGRIQALNRRFRGVDRTTDVICFRYDSFPSQAPKGSLVGDIAINIPQAQIQARKMDHPPRREVRLLLIHGILHLLGYTDYDPVPRRRMFKRQNELLRRWEKKHP